MIDTEKTEKFKAELGGCIGSLMLMVLGIAVGGYVTAYLWNGIVSPIFSLTTLTFWQGCGIDLFVSYLVASVKPKDESYTAMERFVLSLSLTGFYWLIGFIIIQFI